MLGRKCECGGHILSYINFTDLAECCHCHKYYLSVDEEWEMVSKSYFRVLYRKRLVEQQKQNKKKGVLGNE